MRIVMISARRDVLCLFIGSCQCKVIAADVGPGPALFHSACSRDDTSFPLYMVLRHRANPDFVMRDVAGADF